MKFIGWIRRGLFNHRKQSRLVNRKVCWRCFSNETIWNHFPCQVTENLVHVEWYGIPNPTDQHSIQIRRKLASQQQARAVRPDIRSIRDLINNQFHSVVWNPFETISTPNAEMLSRKAEFGVCFPATCLNRKGNWLQSRTGSLDCPMNPVDFKRFKFKKTHSTAMGKSSKAGCWERSRSHHWSIISFALESFFKCIRNYMHASRFCWPNSCSEFKDG